MKTIEDNCYKLLIEYIQHYAESLNMINIFVYRSIQHYNVWAKKQLPVQKFDDFSSFFHTLNDRKQIFSTADFNEVWVLFTIF